MKNTTAIFLIVLAIGLFYTFTNPTYQGAQDKAAAVAEYRNVIGNIEEIVETRDKLLVNYNSLPREEIERLAKVLPANVDTVRLALDLDTIASQYGISIGDVAIDREAERNSTQVVLPNSNMPFQSTLVAVSFVSDYESFKSFLEDLEKSLRIMDVKSINFQAADSGLYEHNIVIETYWVE